MSTGQSGVDQMAWDQSVMNANWEQPPQKKGMSCGCMLLIGLGVLSGLLVLLCCGGVVGMGYYFGTAMSEDPNVVAQVKDEIAPIDIPAGLQPAFSFNMKVPFSGEPMMVWVVYVDKPTQSTLILASLGGPLAEGDPQAFRQQIEASLEEQGLKYKGNVGQWDRSEREIEVRGEPVTFQVATGKDEDSGAQRMEVTGTFQGDKGPVLFSFSGDAEKFDETAIVKTIESIR